ncbi:GNAT family N-acetyltransferase [Paenibacillus hemerocallicola]|uniref:GNAT family N-acetyltransferase n=1 Tax=Paenibacillus hemerocallicola TaxID=1172614 RepID=A0A5C4T762_9BACL|nr:GNAT family N-acetyltransferase [Paenibacillus hemerocallicola]TNJ64878.1 GNAT family N-acetyltransferase [Paenibacillus hemerocallicola]
METITLLNCREERQAYAMLTFPSLHDELLSESEQRKVAAVGAELFGKPIGLVWASWWPQRKRGELRTIYIASAYRGSGIGTALLKTIERVLAEAGCDTLDFKFRAGTAGAPVWQRMTAQWDLPRTGILTFTMSIPQFLAQPWVGAWRTNKRLDIFSWDTLSEAEKARIKEGDNDWYPHHLSPFIRERYLVPGLSVGLRDGNETIGWMTVEEYDDGMVIGDRMFARPPHDGQGRGIMLIAEAARRCCEAGFQTARFDVSIGNVPMRRFVERRMKPCLVDSYEVVHKSKRLGSPQLVSASEADRQGDDAGGVTIGR